MESIALKPGKQSTEFIGKVILQIIIIVNLALSLFKLPSLDISPEVSLSIAGGIEAVWMIFRQWNKRLELNSQTAMAAANKGIELEGIKIASQLKVNQARHFQKMEQMKLDKEPSALEKTLGKLGEQSHKKKGSEPNAKP